MQKFKIGLEWEDKADTWQSEDQLDLNAGMPDRRGQSKNPKVLGVGRS